MVALLDRPRRIRTEEPVSIRLRPNRREAEERIEARRLDHTLPARRQPRLSLTLHRTMDGGLSATSSVPLCSGERLSLFMPAHPACRQWGALGHVVRCEPARDGYRIAIAFDSLPAA
jgi:hypothetical protein